MTALFYEVTGLVMGLIVREIFWVPKEVSFLRLPLALQLLEIPNADRLKLFAQQFQWGILIMSCQSFQEFALDRARS